jgi:CRP-like cAMP-binding protein
VPAGYVIVTCRSPDGDLPIASVVPMDAAKLDAIPLFANLSLDQRASVASACEELEVEEGTVLVREGDFGHAVFAITYGTADVVHEGAVVNTLGAGDHFGEIAVMAGGRRSASVVARSSLKLVTIFNREIWRLEREAPEVAAVLRETISARAPK